MGRNGQGGGWTPIQDLVTPRFASLALRTHTSVEGELKINTTYLGEEIQLKRDFFFGCDSQFLSFKATPLQKKWNMNINRKMHKAVLQREIPQDSCTTFLLSGLSRKPAHFQSHKIPTQAHLLLSWCFPHGFVECGVSDNSKRGRRQLLRAAAEGEAGAAPRRALDPPGIPMVP